MNLTEHNVSLPCSKVPATISHIKPSNQPISISILILCYDLRLLLLNGLLPFSFPDQNFILIFISSMPAWAAQQGNRLGDRKNGVRPPTKVKDFSCNLCVQTDSETQQFSYPMGNGDPFTGGKVRPRRDADHSPPSIPEANDEQELYLLSHQAPSRRLPRSAMHACISPVKHLVACLWITEFSPHPTTKLGTTSCRLCVTAFSTYSQPPSAAEGRVVRRQPEDALYMVTRDWTIHEMQPQYSTSTAEFRRLRLYVYYALLI
jgi:hypothetical protein